MEHRDMLAQALQGHQVREISLGKSGAQVYELDGSMVLKYADRRQLGSRAAWKACLRELEFYQWFSWKGISLAPEIVFSQTECGQMLLVTRRYPALSQEAARGMALDWIGDMLARLHSLTPPDFLAGNGAAKEPLWNQKRLRESLAGWQQVLEEHPKVFEPEALETALEQIDGLNRVFACRESCLVHGDFHCENLLLDWQEKKVLACDWQSAGMGDPAGDLSFFASRMEADGFPVRWEQLLKGYCRSCQRLGISRDKASLEARMRLNRLNTALAFWHQYLHGSSRERVERVYTRLAEDTAWLMQAGGLSPRLGQKK